MLYASIAFLNSSTLANTMPNLKIGVVMSTSALKVLKLKFTISALVSVVG